VDGDGPSAPEAAGGWKTVANGLGAASETGKRLKAWRDAIYTDLKQY